MSVQLLVNRSVPRYADRLTGDAMRRALAAALSTNSDREDSPPHADGAGSRRQTRAPDLSDRVLTILLRPGQRHRQSTGSGHLQLAGMPGVGLAGRVNGRQR